MNIKRGEIYYIEQHQTYGTEQSGGRPFLVVAPDELLINGTGALCVPLTTKPKKLLPQHTTIHSTRVPSTVLCEQARYVDEELFGDYYCTVTDEEMREVEKCLLEAVSITGERLAFLAKEMSANFLNINSKNEPQSKTIDELKEIIENQKIEIIKLQAQNEAYIGLIKNKM